MTILFTRFPLESTFGGAEVQTLDLMKGLKQRGHTVEFLGSCPVLLKKTSELGIRNWELGIGNPPVTKFGAVSFLWRRKKMQQRLMKQMAESRWQKAVIIMLSLSEKLLLTEWAAKQGMKVVWIEHDKVGRWLSANPWKNMLLRQARHATTVVVSELSREIYLQLGWPAERLVAIGNGIDPKRISLTPTPAYRQGRLSGSAGEGDREAVGEGLRIGTVARLSKEKGVDILLSAMGHQCTSTLVTLWIAGEGPERKKLEKLARTFGIADRVRFLGSAIDIGNFYRNIDVFVLPSREHDPCPLAPLEAMALGVPVILTRACGTADYFRNGIDMLIVDTGSADAISRALVEAKNPDLRRKIAVSGQRRVLEHFTAERMVEKYEKLFLA